MDLPILLIATLISIVVSLGIAIYFRGIDKNNSSLDKIRKYADSRESELDKKYRKIQSDFDMLNAEFTSNTTHAAAAVKRLEQQNAEFNEKMKTFNQSINSVQSIKKQIDGYAEILKDLNEMTAQVEENLDRIRKESKVVDNLTVRLDKNRHDIELIGKRIPDIVDKFSEENTKQLETVRTRLLNQYEDYAVGLEAKIKEVQRAADDTLVSIRQRIQSAYDEASKQADSLENTAFEHLSEQAQRRSDAYMKELRELTDALQKELENQFGAASAKINERFSTLETGMNERSEAIKSAFNAKTEEAEKSYKSAESKFVVDAKASMDKMQGDLLKKFSAAETSFSEKIRELKEKYIQMLDSVSGKNSDLIAKITERFEADQKKLDDKYGAQISAVLSKNDNNYESLTQKFEGDLERFRERYTSEFDGAVAASGERMESFRRELEEEHRRLLEEFGERVAGAREESERRIAQWSSESGEQIERMASESGARIEECGAETRRLIEELSERTEARIEEVRSGASERMRGLEAETSGQLAEIGRLRERCGSELAGLEAELRERTEQYSQRSHQLHDEIASMQTNLEETIKKLSTEAAQSVRQTEDSVRNIKEQCEDASKKVERLQPDLEDKILRITETLESAQHETQKKIDAFQSEANSQIDMLSRNVADAIRRAIAEGEERHVNILEDVDSQLGVYKKEIEYKLSQIQFSQSDVDNLENSLRGAMREVQNRVIGDFENFVAIQQQQHDDFSNQIREESDNLTKKVNEISSSWDDLKAAATGSMSSKLKEFEVVFNQTLATHTDQIDSDIADWKHDLDSKLSALMNNYEDARREVEKNYSEQLRANVEMLQTKAGEHQAKITASINQTQTEMQDSIREIQEVISGFKNETNASIINISQNSESELKQEIERSLAMIQANLEKVQNELLEDVRNFEETVHARQETGTSSIDAALSEFNTWKQQIKDQMEDSKTVFKGDLETFRHATQSKIDDIGQRLVQNMNEYEESVIKQQNELAAKIADLNNRAEKSVKSYETRSDEILSHFGTMYDQMLTTTEQKLRVQNDEATSTLDALRREIQEAEDIGKAKVESLLKEIHNAEESNKANQSKMVLKMQDDANALQTHISEISRELQDIKSNIQIYDKADKMKRQLEDNIQNLNSMFNKVDTYSQNAAKFNAQYNDLLKINDDIANQLKNFENQKIKVMSLEGQFSKMIDISNSIEERMQSLSTTKDDLQSMEVTVRNYNDKLQYITEQYERLAKKDEVINRIKADVDTQFDKLKNLETLLINCDRQAESLPKEIKDVQDKVNKILDNGPKISEAVGRLDKLDLLISDTEKKITTLESLDSGFKQTEMNLQALSRDVDNKYRVLHDMTKQDLKTHNVPQGYTNPRQRDMVRQLKMQGWSIPEIAARLEMTENEVDLILQLPRD